MKKLAFIFLIGFIPFLSFSQINKDGLPFIDQYNDEDYGEAGQIWAIEKDLRGVMYFGCNYGLKTFDGENWKSYNNPNSTIIRSLAKDENGFIYFGSENDFGVMLSEKSGELRFKSIALSKYHEDSLNFASIWKTLVANNKVYFQSFEKLFYCDLPLRFDNSDSLLNELKILSPTNAPFHLSFSVNDQLYIREWTKGLCKIENDEAILIPGGEQFAFLRVYVMVPYDETKILIGTREAGFFLYDTKKKSNAITPFELSNQELIINSSIYSGTTLNNGTFAIGTFNNGIIIFNKEGKISQILDENNGIPDNNVLSIFHDPETTNIWFRTDNGLFKADLKGPFTRWNEFQGLSGIVLDMTRLNNKIYASTNIGVFYLDDTNHEKISFKKIHTEDWCRDLMEFKIPGSNESVLLSAHNSGVFIIEGESVKNIAEVSGVNKLLQSKKDPSILFIATTEGLKMMKYGKYGWGEPVNHRSINTEIISILEPENNIVLGTSGSGLLLIKHFEDSLVVKVDSANGGLPLEGRDFNIYQIKNNTVVATGAGLYSLEINDSVTAKPYTVFGENYTNRKSGVYAFKEDEDAYWMSVYGERQNAVYHKLIRFIGKDKLKIDSFSSGKIPQKSTSLIYPDGNYVWIGNEKGLFKFNKSTDKNYKSPFNTLITKVSTTKDSILFSGNYIIKENETHILSQEQVSEMVPIMNYKFNTIIFEWAAPFYEEEKETEYSYRLIGETEEWSKWEIRSDIRFTNLWEGDYTFEVKARNIYLNESSTAKYSFTILPPWFRTIWAYIGFVILVVFIVFVIIRLYTKKLKHENEKLEQIVKERTAEIRMQNEEITAQRDEIQLQKEHVEKARDKIEEQKQSILDSIHYASRIQQAVLPPDEYLQEVLGEHFVLFRPRDIVSGDFYWATQRGNKTVIVAADCTGHGVPGAFMSMLGISFLNEIVNKEEVLQANIILNRLRQNVKRSLRQTGKDNEAKDGMDLALCIIDMDEMQLQFAGAYNPLYLLRNKEISRVKPDRMPIGIYLREKESFTNNIVDIKKGDYLYIFSDGFVDQFGGPKDSKIKSEKFKSLLLDNHQKPPIDQKNALNTYLEEWMAHKDETGRVYKQVDDILVIGIEI